MHVNKPRFVVRSLLQTPLLLAEAVLLLTSPIAEAAGKYAAGTSAIEIAQLPKYCYAQYVDEKYATDPVYSIQGCGYAMNHFCPALVSLMRAKKTNLPLGERRGYANHAETEAKYTIRDMYPTCPIRSDVFKALEQAQGLQRSLNAR